MPRPSTGKPPGRPRGSGSGLGADAPRLTIRLPQSLHEQWTAFAAEQGTHDLSACLRTAMAHYMTCPHNGRTETVPESVADNGQTETLLSDEGSNGQTESDTASFDATKFRLAGKLCPQGHDWQGTGRSLVRIANERCWECDKAMKREVRARKKAAAQGTQGARPVHE